MNSAVMTSLAAEDATPIERVTGTVEADVLDIDWPRFGHSLFQWPFRPQILQLLSKMRCCRVFRLVQGFFPLDLPLKPLDFPLLEIGQNPLARYFSLSFRRASM